MPKSRLDDLIEKRTRRERALAHIKAAQEALLSAYLALKDDSFLDEFRMALDRSRTYAREAEKALAVELHDVGDAIAREPKPELAALLETPEAAMAIDRATGAVQRLRELGLSGGTINLTGGTLTLR